MKPEPVLKGRVYHRVDSIFHKLTCRGARKYSASCHFAIPSDCDRNTLRSRILWMAIMSPRMSLYLSTLTSDPESLSAGGCLWRRMARRVALRRLPLALLSASLSVLLLYPAVPALAQQDVQVSTRDGLLSIQASNASASRLAQVLSERLGIRVIVTGNTEARVNIDIIEEPVDKALAKLSPNHMLVHDGRRRDSTIVEVVLMMDENNAGSNSGGGDSQFLPSGSPADDVVISDDQPIPPDGGELRDVNRSEMARDAAGETGFDASGMPLDMPADYPSQESFDPVTGLPIDPTTGLPIE